MKRKKTAHNIEDHVNKIMDDIKDEENLVEQAIKQVKMSIRGKKFTKNIPSVSLNNVSFHSKKM